MTYHRPARNQGVDSYGSPVSCLWIARAPLVGAYPKAPCIKFNPRGSNAFPARPTKHGCIAEASKALPKRVLGE